MASRSTIVSPHGWVLKDLLDTIERDETSFTQGRRNNDLVNWFIVKRLMDIEAGDIRRLDQIIRAYERDFRDSMMNVFTHTQKMHITGWKEAWAWKIQVLCEHYWRYDSAQLANLWLPMDYAVQCEGQLALT